MWDLSSGNVHGGFIKEPSDGSSPSSNGKEVQRSQSVVPVVVRQLKDCPEDEFKLFGMPTQILTLVGILRELEVQSTKATYLIEDHTGSINAILWLENDSNNTLNLPCVKENCYVRVYGSLRTQDGQKTLMVLKMFAVDNINVVITHLLEVVYTRLEAENMEKGHTVTVNNPANDLIYSMGYLNDTRGSSDTGLTGLQEKVYNILKMDTEDAGVHINVVLTKFPQPQHRNVKSAIEFLVSEGHIYSTVDNDHYKAT